MDNSTTQHNLAQIFGVEEQTTANTEVTVYEQEHLPVVEGENTREAKEDFNKARGNMLKLLDHGDTVMAELLDLSSRSQDSKMYDVLVKLMKTMSEVNVELVDLQGKKHMAIFDDGPKVINNNLFITTDELLQKIKDGRKKLEQKKLEDGT